MPSAARRLGLQLALQTSLTSWVQAQAVAETLDKVVEMVEVLGLRHTSAGLAQMVKVMDFAMEAAENLLRLLDLRDRSFPLLALWQSMTVTSSELQQSAHGYASALEPASG